MEEPTRGGDELDLRCLEYVSSYDEHLMCPICHCPFIKPVRLQCDHIFCRTCLDSAIAAAELAADTADDFRCPSCRTSAQSVCMDVPRLLVNMCDELLVKCPYASEGCEEILSRAHVQSHVDKYCGYKLLDCPSPSCNKKTRRSCLHPDRRCMHELRQCSQCQECVMDQDYNEHMSQNCPTLNSVCPGCQVTVPLKELREHIVICPEVIHPCSASKYGCPVKVKRTELLTHEESCPLIAIGPYFEAQNSRLDSMELTVRHLRQRNEILEDGLASIRSTLVESSPTTLRRNGLSSDSSHTESHTDPLALSEIPEHQPPTDRTATPFQSNATTYLLSLHESLREEVAQLSQALTDLDARASMALMNECLRLKEDMAHTKAAVTSVRMQVQWLMNPRLHHGQRSTTSVGSGDETGPSRTRSLGSPSLTTPGPSNHTSGVSTASVPLRRLSDGGREGTKL